MRIIFPLFTLFLGSIAIVSCKKTPEYVAQPYKCECGNLTWQGEEYPLLGTTYILTDSTNAKSRRYHITADVLPEDEVGPHGLSLWIELDDIGNGGSFTFDGGAFSAQVDEYNPNDPTDTLRIYEPISGSVQVGAAPITGGSESVSFQLTLNQRIDDQLFPGNSSCSGNFVVGIAPW
jgi:hypothetical protein